MTEWRRVIVESQGGCSSEIAVLLEGAKKLSGRLRMKVRRLVILLLCFPGDVSSTRSSSFSEPESSSGEDTLSSISWKILNSLLLKGCSRLDCFRMEERVVEEWNFLSIGSPAFLRECSGER